MSNNFLKFYQGKALCHIFITTFVESSINSNSKMKNILFDIISIQGTINGGAEFTFRTLEELLTLNNLQITGLYDSNLIFAEKDLEFYQKRLHKMIDIQDFKDINIIIKQEQIDSFFIGIAQRYFNYNLENISCKTTIVIHDIGDIETYDNRISSLWKREKRFQIKLFPKKNKKSPFDNYHPLIRFFKKSNVNIVTVSEYSKSSILYYFPELACKNIDVLYPPLRKFRIQNKIENNTLKDFLSTPKTYFLLLNIHRKDKNPFTALKVFERYFADHDGYLVTTGEGKKMFPNHINLPLLSSTDLVHAYKHAYALIFPSLQEGFGYPPLEAMGYGIPVLSSNVCSMPIILKDSAIMFSPFYKNDLFMKLQILTNNYEYYKEQATTRYNQIIQKQQKDFCTLIKKIITT